MRYLARTSHLSEMGGDVLACLCWTSPAWKMAERYNWIGWTGQRASTLHYIVNNSRFLILPWVHVKGLASKILAHCARQLPSDWETQYGYRPLLLEMLVDAARFKGTCYRAANWISVGRTTGRGRMGTFHQTDESAKDIYFYPLCRKVQDRLCNGSAPTFPASCPDQTR